MPGGLQLVTKRQDRPPILTAVVTATPASIKPIARPLATTDTGRITLRPTVAQYSSTAHDQKGHRAVMYDSDSASGAQTCRKATRSEPHGAAKSPTDSRPR